LALLKVIDSEFKWLTNVTEIENVNESHQVTWKAETRVYYRHTHTDTHTHTHTYTHTHTRVY